MKTELREIQEENSIMKEELINKDNEIKAGKEGLQRLKTKKEMEKDTAEIKKCDCENKVIKMVKGVIGWKDKKS